MDAFFKRFSAHWLAAGARRTCAHHIILIAVGVLAFGLNLGATRLWDVDEAIFSQAAVEMFDRGDWTTPYYNGQLFSHKPPFMYWCQIVAFEFLGKSELATRLFSALFSIGTLVLVYEIGRTLFNVRTGLWAGISLAGCINFAIISRAATPDAHLTFFCTLALLILIRGTSQHSLAGQASAETPWRPILPPGWRTYVLAYSAMALGTLVKGPVAIVLPMAVWGMFLLIEQRRGSERSQSLQIKPASMASADETKASRMESVWLALMQTITFIRRSFWPPYFLQTVWKMRPLTAVFVLLLIAGPWYGAVAWHTSGKFLEEFFLVHNLGRATSAMEHHYGSVIFYPVTICIGTFPWCVLLWPAVAHVCRGIKSDDSARSGYVLLACWVGVWMGCFSLVATKLANYLVPAYPAFALAFATLIDSWFTKQGDLAVCRWLRRAWLTFAATGLGCLIAVPIVTRILFSGEWTPALVGLVPLFGAAVGWYQTSRGESSAAITTIACTSVVFCTVTLAFGALPIDSHKNTHLFAPVIKSYSTDSLKLATYKYSPPSLIFYSEMPFERLRSRVDVEAHFRQHPDNAFLVTPENQLVALKDFLPDDMQVLYRTRMFLKTENVVLLGRKITAPGTSKVDHCRRSRESHLMKVSMEHESTKR
jgi:4-amino-4-deoxy-L-arabinose transferase-like glycosyltransferase